MLARLNKIRRKKVRKKLKTPDNKCALCGCRMPSHDVTIDHIIPLSRGGTHKLENLQLTHLECNQMKGAEYSLQEAKALHNFNMWKRGNL